MRHLFIACIFLFVGSTCAQQMAFNFVEVTAKENSEDQIERLFDEFFANRERKSGAVFLERLRHGREDGRTHRIVFLWELNKRGFVTKPQESEGDAFWRGIRNNVESWGEARAGRVMNLNPGDEKKNPAIHIWDIRIEDPVAFAKAQQAMVRALPDTFEDRLVAFGSYDVNKPNGATHWALLSGKDINDHLSLYQDLQTVHNEVFSAYIRDRGKVTQVKDFVVERIKTFQ